MFRKFLIWIVKNLLILLLVTLIFSAVAFDLPGMVKGLFKDIFQYASPEAQKEVVGKLTSACSSLDGKGSSELQQQMPNGQVLVDFSKIGSLCKDYNSGKINDNEFFYNVVGSAIPDKFELPKGQAFEKYNSIMNFLIKNKRYYLIILLALLATLYLSAGNLSAFLMILAGISFSMGILILLPYAAIMVYAKLVGFDTTPIVSTILGGSASLGVNALISVVLLMILRTYTGLIISLGIIFLGIGIAGKIYSWKLNKQTRQIAKRGKKPEKDENNKAKAAKEERVILKKGKENDEDVDESYKHRDRSAKEILDELEEMHKNKTKKD